MFGLFSKNPKKESAADVDPGSQSAPHELVQALPVDGKSTYAGMSDFQLLTPNGEHRVVAVYKGEPPHGDSYHELYVDGVKIPGFAWGGLFACTNDSRYIAFSWMSHLYQRKTLVVDMAQRTYFCLPEYLYNFTFTWPHLIGVGEGQEGRSFEFAGFEDWVGY